eukprot:9184371-Alexandrium_andersonii.AAC.1
MPAARRRPTSSHCNSWGPGFLWGCDTGMPGASVAGRICADTSFHGLSLVVGLTLFGSSVA